MPHYLDVKGVLVDGVCRFSQPLRLPWLRHAIGELLAKVCHISRLLGMLVDGVCILATCYYARRNKTPLAGNSILLNDE